MSRAQQLLDEQYGGYASPYSSHPSYPYEQPHQVVLEPPSHGYSYSSEEPPQKKKKPHGLLKFAAGAAVGVGGAVALGHHIASKYPTASSLLQGAVKSGYDIS